MIKVHYTTKTEIDSVATGRSLYEARQERGLTQEALADKLGYTKQYICKLESGNAGFSDRLVRELERVL